MSPEKLVYMANQIGKFFAPQSEEKAIAGIAEHLRKYWEARMQSAIFQHLNAGGVGLHPRVLKAIASLRPSPRAVAPPGPPPPMEQPK